MFENLISTYATLIGVAALIAVIINLLKAANIVRDGQAQTWSAALNLLGLILLFALKVLIPEMNLEIVDSQAAELANVLQIVGGYVIQVLSSKWFHNAIRGVPVFGLSHEDIVFGD